MCVGNIVQLVASPGGTCAPARFEIVRMTARLRRNNIIFEIYFTSLRYLLVNNMTEIFLCYFNTTIVNWRGKNTYFRIFI